MSTTERALLEFENRIVRLENEVRRRKDVANYLNYLYDSDTLTYEDISCAISWLDHTIKTADEIIDFLEKGD